MKVKPFTPEEAQRLADEAAAMECTFADKLKDAPVIEGRFATEEEIYRFGAMLIKGQIADKAKQ